MKTMRSILWLLALLLTTSLACNAPAGDAIQVFLEAGLGKCRSADRELYVSVSRHIGQEPETPADPETARYEVCYSRWSREPMSARIIENLDASELARFDGTYVGTEIERPLGAIIEVLDTEVTVEVVDGELEGEIVQAAVTQSSSGGERPYTKTERAVQTIQLEGRLRPSGAFDGSGLTSVEYTLMSCEPEENCLGVAATRSRAGGTAVSLEGTLIDGTMVGEVINSVSGARLSFEAERTDQ